MGLRERIGVDVGRKLRIEDAIEWETAHAVRWIDIQLDTRATRWAALTRAASQLPSPHFSKGRCIGALDLRKSCCKNGLSRRPGEPDADRL